MITDNAVKTGYAAVNGLELYYEIHGAGRPLVLLHGGLGSGSMFGELLPHLAEGRQVITVDLQGHGRTADIERPLRYEFMAGDIAALIEQLGLPQADLMGYSLGGGVALRTAIQTPGLVRKLVVIGVAFKREGMYPEVLANIDQMSGAAAEFMVASPVYQHYASVAPRPQDFAQLLDKTGDLLRQPYDWSDEVAALSMPTMIVFGDADSVPATHMAQFFQLLGGSQADAGWDGSNMPKCRLAVLPGTTHYNSIESPLLVPSVIPFLDASGE